MIGSRPARGRSAGHVLNQPICLPVVDWPGCIRVERPERELIHALIREALLYSRFPRIETSIDRELFLSIGKDIIKFRLTAVPERPVDRRIDPRCLWRSDSANSELAESYPFNPALHFSPEYAAEMRAGAAKSQSV